MCWMTALGIGTSLLGTAASYSANVSAANQQNQYYYNNAEAANQDAVEKYSQAQLKQIQEEAATASDLRDIQVATMKAEGTALASTENAGLSTDLVLRDIARQGAEYKNKVYVNAKNTKLQSDSDKKAIEAETRNRINSVSQAAEPSVTAAAISGLGSILPYVDGSRKYEFLGRGDVAKEGR